jgi:hypothetical protein
MHTNRGPEPAGRSGPRGCCLTVCGRGTLSVCCSQLLFGPDLGTRSGRQVPGQRAVDGDSVRQKPWQGRNTNRPSFGRLLSPKGLAPSVCDSWYDLTLARGVAISQHDVENRHRFVNDCLPDLVGRGEKIFRRSRQHLHQASHRPHEPLCPQGRSRRRRGVPRAIREGGHSRRGVLLPDLGPRRTLAQARASPLRRPGRRPCPQRQVQGRRRPAYRARRSR